MSREHAPSKRPGTPASSTASPAAASAGAATAEGPAIAAQRRKIEHAFGAAAQMAGPDEELQKKSPEEEEVQKKDAAGASAAPANRTGMPDQLKAGVESLSGMDMSDVRVHRNSDMPRQLNALAYAQGKDIHLGPGQEQHLPHEAWHLVQQREGRVQPTTQVGGVAVNDDAGLESEADAMGAKAAAQGKKSDQNDQESD
jgi:hypothetical protein